MNPIQRENYEFIRDVLQGRGDNVVRYQMPKDAKFLVMNNGRGFDNDGTS